MSITFARSQSPITLYVAQNQVLPLWVKVTRLLNNLSEANIIFIGQIKRVTFKGLNAKADCVGFENYLNQPIPHFRYQPLCNWQVFDSLCAKPDTAFKITTSSTTISSNGLVVTSPDFGLQSADYYTNGLLTFNGDARMITEHIGNDLTIRFKMPYLCSGCEVTAYAGCDRNIETCRDKFDNVVNFGGHPFIPLDNPVLW